MDIGVNPNRHTLRVICLYKWKRGFSAAVADPSIVAAFEVGFSNESTIRRWYRQRPQHKPKLHPKKWWSLFDNE